MTDIAYQYALAVFSLADEAKKAEDFKVKLSQFVEEMDDEQHKFFSHPKIDKRDKIAIVERVVKDQLLKNFIKVLIDNDRVSLIEAILVSYQEILDTIHKVMQVQVYSGKAISKENIEKIKAKLSKSYNRNIEINTKIDTAIIGGYRVEFEGNVIDETINRQLDNLKSNLLE